MVVVVVAVVRGARDDKLHRPRKTAAALCCIRPSATQRNHPWLTDGDGGGAATVAVPEPSSFRVDGAAGDGPPGADAGAAAAGAGAAADGVGDAAVDGAGVAGAAAADAAAVVAADDGDGDGGKPRLQQLRQR